MAHLVKARARKPLVSNGVCYTGNAVDWVTSETPGMLQAKDFLYTLTINGGADGNQYEAHLTESEMLDTTAKWIESFNNKRKQDARNAQRSA